MPSKAKCPVCQAVVPFTESSGKQSVTCPECDEVFDPSKPPEVRTGGRGNDRPIPLAKTKEEEAEAPAKPKATPVAKPTAAKAKATPVAEKPKAKPADEKADDEEALDFAEKGKPKSRKEQDADAGTSKDPADVKGVKGKPRRRRDDDDDDDDDDRPRRRRKKKAASGGLGGWLILGLGLGAVLLFAGFLALVAWVVNLDPAPQNGPAVAGGGPGGMMIQPPVPPDNPPDLDPRAKGGDGGMKARPGVNPGDDPPIKLGGKDKAGPGGTPFRPGNPAPPPVAPPGNPGNPGRPADPPARADGPFVKPAAAPVEIKPTAAADGSTVSLPSSANAACVGGGGRFIIFRLPASRQIAVFDTTQGKVAKYLPLAEDGGLVAAGMNKLFVVLPGANVIQRYDLTTFEKELTVPNPLGGLPKVALMGHLTDGPLYIAGQNVNGPAAHYGFVDAKTMKPAPLDPAKGGRGGPAVSDWYPPTVKISGDGRVFAWWSPGLSPSGLNSMVIGEDGAKSYNEHTSVGAIVPGPDGTLFTGGGLYTPELKPIGDKKAAVYWVGGPVPAVSGPYYLEPAGSGSPPGGAAKEKAGLVLKMVGDNRPLVTLNDLAGLGQPAGVPGVVAPALYDRVFLIPAAKLLVVVGPSGDKLHLHAFDLKARLDQSGVDYLLVASRPPVAVKGRKFTYSPDVWSKKGGVKLKLESGPDGMKVNGTTLTWDVPADFAGTADVLLTVTDASGQETFHTFRLAPVDKAPDGVGAAPADPDPAPKAPPANDLAKKDERPAAPAPPVSPIRPTPLPGDTATLTLPAPAGATAFGGGGRFLLAHLPKTRQLAVFDANEGKVVKYVPLAGDGALIAAGRDKFFVAYPDARTLARYSLSTFEKELTVLVEGNFPPSALAMGAASDGPLLVMAGAVALYDPVKLKPIPPPDGGHPNVTGFAGALYRASPDGTAFTASAEFGGGSSLLVLGPDGKRTVVACPFGRGIPGGDGETIYGNGAMADFAGKPIGQQRGGNGGMVWYVPAAHGPFYLSLNETKAAGRQYIAARLHVGREVRPIVDLGELKETDGLVDWITGRWDPMENHVFYVPAANLVAVLNKTRDKLSLRKLDLRAELAKAKVDYLFVTSKPPAAVRGKTFSYTPAVWSNKGGVKLKVEAGPDGLKAAGASVTWDVPKDAPEKPTKVILTVSDATGQELFHSFDLTPTDTDPGPVADAFLPGPAPAADPVAPAPKPMDPPPNDLAKKDPEPKAAPPGSPVPAITPTKLIDPATVQLPAAFNAVCLGGNGRYVLLRLPTTRQVAVFDVCEAKVVRYVPIAEEGALVAATADKLFVLNPGANVIQRYALATFEKEATLPNPVAGTAHMLLAPHGAAGPLFILADNDQPGGGLLLTPLDPAKLAPLPDARQVQVWGQGRGPFGPSVGVRVSADGKVVATFTKDTNARPEAYRFNGKEFTKIGVGARLLYGHYCPGPDGRHLYTTAGVFTPEGRRVGPEVGVGRYALPSAQGGAFYLSIDVAGAPHGDKNKASKLRLHLTGEDEVLAELDRVELPRGINTWDREPITTDERVRLVESAGVVVVLPADNKAVEVYPVNPWAALEKSGKDYLFVTSNPPAAVFGKTFRYTPAVKSKKGGVKVRLEAGPDGMKVAPDGTVTWDVPKNPNGPVTVILSVSDSSGKDVFHTFDLTPTDKETVAAPAAPADPAPAPKGPGDVAPKGPGEIAPPAPPKPVAARPDPLKAEWAGETAEVKLPEAATDMVVGGGGRFLLFTLASGRELAVVDLSTGKLAKSIPLAASPAHVAAGARVAVVYYPNAKQIHVWSLATLERLKSVPAPDDLTAHPLTSFVMGNASDGPVFFHQRQPKLTAYLDLDGFRVRRVPVDKFGWGPTTIEVSADGSLVAAAGGGWAGTLIAQVRGGRVTKTTEVAKYNLATYATGLPTYDGRQVLTIAGALGPELDGTPVNGFGDGYDWPKGGFLVPAGEPGFYLRVAGKAAAKGPRPGVEFGVGAEAELTVFDASNRKVATLAGFKEFEKGFLPPPRWIDYGLKDVIPPKLAANRFRFYPAAGLLATLAADNTTVVLRKVDLGKFLKAADPGHLAVGGAPPAAVRGKTFTFAPAVWSGKGGVKLVVKKGPEGMKVEGEKVVWAVPADATEEAEVTLVATDSAGKEATYSFRLQPAAE